jgi:hypothetical protein
LTAGLCICKGSDADHLPKVRPKVNNALKLLAKKSKACHHALTHAGVVACFVGYKEVSDAGPGIAAEHSSQVLWLHIGFQSLSPFKSSFHLLKGPGDTAAITAEHLMSSRHLLTSSGKAFSFWQGLALLDKAFQWGMLLFLIDPSCKLMGGFIPNSVEVTFCPISELPGLHTVWNPSAKKRRRTSAGGWKIDTDGLDEELERLLDEEEELDISLELDPEGSSGAEVGVAEMCNNCVYTVEIMLNIDTNSLILFLLSQPLSGSAQHIH